MPSPTCSALTREKGRNYVCQLDLDHKGKHDDLLGHQWESEPQVHTGERFL